MSKKNTYTQTYVLLDAHALIHRAYHALPDFSTRAGVPTGALYGLTSMILRVIADFKPDHIIACYDLPEKTFRHVAYEEYKGTRKKIDDVLITQLISSKEVFGAFNIPIYEMPGFEADDVIGTLATILKKDPQNKIIIASGDMDTMQLIDKDQVVVYTLKKGITDTIIYDEKAVHARYGFLPISIPDYKGLRGDTSDNIIGIKGIGEKTATHLIDIFKNIEAMYAFLSKKGDVAFQEKTGLTPRLVALIKDNEDEALFSKELATIRLDVPLKYTATDTHQEMFSIENVEALCEKYEFKSLLQKARTLYQITDEAKSDAVHDTQIDQVIAKKYFLALSLLDSENTKPTQDDFWYFSRTHDYVDACTNIEKQLQEEELFDLWETLEVPLLTVVEQMTENGILLDTLYLKNLSNRYHKELTLLEKKIWKLAGKEFNVNSPKQLGEVLFEHLKIHELDKVKIKKTASGTFSTKETDLEKFAQSHEIIPLILEYRELQKLLSTYIDVLPKQIHNDGRLHSTFNQLGTSTGRFNSQEPNLQNIPIKTEKGKAIRRGFVSQKGYSFIACDYSQIELRVAAFLSQDPFLLGAFTDGADIHTRVAMQVFHVAEAQVTSEMRRRAKIINFGILYGMGSTALAQNLGVSKKDAQIFIDEYKKELPVLHDYLEKILIDVRKEKYTRTFFGRKRNFQKIASPIPFIKAMYERMAINAPIQGTAADILKYAMVSLDQEIKKRNLVSSIRLVLQIHDEIIFEVADEHLTEAQTLIEKTMQDILVIHVGVQYAKKIPPLEVHISIAKSMDLLK